ncbi:hypothetical protein [Psychroserpens sp.]|uniref:hypothetical protein n=1 Tax=Psychroserpens sp. TaxID=2020870 RepID=UPI001B2CA394|nr:hypothetical protein [Psychroserpens sp.]MBO6605678.1 hypothetical protein [Psychroserpens sp.]MBO6630582.1 hypothetical protein [Psychroserpens sp.]MBO6652951.1 hypothetical protein [Psychroserpens sp.]MBO6681277.1 hypothetical protein [Psychroserpens sp.]MBO6749052.1 hypothetical protein [Psychroserpens sp.]
MRNFSLLFVLIVTLSFTDLNAQSSTEKKEDYKVKLFSDDEYANLHMWFYNQVQQMKLSERADDEYGSYLSMHVSRMMRLDDKDKGYSKSTIIQKYNEIFNNLNKDVKPVLNEEQFRQHLEIMSVLSKAIFNKLDQKMD